MLIATFKQNIDLYTVENNPFIFNLPPTLEHLRFLFVRDAVRALARATPRSWASSSSRSRSSSPCRPPTRSPASPGAGGERLGIAIFLTYLIPPTLLFIPLSRVVAILGLQDSIFSVVLVYPSMTIPFSIWLLMGFFKSIPRELEDAAHGGRPDALRRVHPDGRPDLGLRDPDGRHLQLHARDAGVRLRADVHLAGVATR